MQLAVRTAPLYVAGEIHFVKICDLKVRLRWCFRPTKTQYVFAKDCFAGTQSLTDFKAMIGMRFFFCQNDLDFKDLLHDKKVYDIDHRGLILCKNTLTLHLRTKMRLTPAATTTTASTKYCSSFGST